MIKINIKLLLITTIFFTQFPLITFAMERNNEDQNNSSTTHRSLKTEEKQKDEEHPQHTPIGGIISFAGENSPKGWLMCDGKQYHSKDYPDLYEIIQTKYVPDSEKWVLKANEVHDNKLFHVPDLRGRVIVAPDNKSERVKSSNTLGKSGGEESHTLTGKEIPPLVATAYPPNHHWIGAGTHGISISPSSDSFQPHNNMQPYLVLNYIIKAKKQ